MTIAIIIVVRLYLDVNRRSVVLDLVTVPPELLSEGYSQEGFSRLLKDELDLIENEVNSGRHRENFAISGSETLPKFEVPATKLSYAEVVSLVQEALGIAPLRVTGEVISVPGSAGFTVFVRLTKGDVVRLSEPLTVAHKSADESARTIAFSVLRKIDPPLLAAYMFLTNDDRKAALALTETPNWHDDQPEWTHNVRGALWHDLKNYDAAEKEFRSAIAAKPDWATAHINLGNVLADSDVGRYDDADKEYAEAIKLNPAEPRAYASWANAFIRKAPMGDKTAEAEALRRIGLAVVMNPKSAKCHIYLAQFLASHNLEGADKEYETAIALAPDDPSIYYRWASTLRGLDRSDEAIEQLKKAASLNPTDYRVYEDWGNSLAAQGDWFSSAEKYAHALDLNPHVRSPFDFLNDAGGSLEALSEALNGFEKANDARFATTYSLWGYSLHYKQRDTEALAKYDIALKLDPKSLAAHFGKAQVLAQLGDLESAEREFHAATGIASNGQYVDIYKQWGDTLRSHGLYKRAEVVYRSVIRQVAKEDPQESTSDSAIAIYYGLSDALAHQGKKQESDRIAAVGADLKNRQFEEQLFR